MILPSGALLNASAAGLVSFTVVNHHTGPVKTVLTRGCDQNGYAPFPILVAANGSAYDELAMTGFSGVGGHCGDGNPLRKIHIDSGVVKVNETIKFVVPRTWHGKMSLVDDKFEMMGQAETLLEGSFMYQQYSQEYGEHRLDFDVSMVDGFSVPLTCSCGGPVLSGCSWDLMALNPCPGEHMGAGHCRNPLRANGAVSSAMDFFKPCEGAAYTFPNDHRANVNGGPNCQKDGVTCCIGTNCEPHANQCAGAMAANEVCSKFQ